MQKNCVPICEVHTYVSWRLLSKHRKENVSFNIVTGTGQNLSRLGFTLGDISLDVLRKFPPGDRRQ